MSSPFGWVVWFAIFGCEAVTAYVTAALSCGYFSWRFSTITVWMRSTISQVSVKEM
jgi:hypothetical protein